MEDAAPSLDEIVPEEKRSPEPSGLGLRMPRPENRTTPRGLLGVVSRSEVGAPSGTRTHDLQVRNLTLYPLSYGRTM